MDGRACCRILAVFCVSWMTGYRIPEPWSQGIAFERAIIVLRAWFSRRRVYGALRGEERSQVMALLTVACEGDIGHVFDG